MLIRFSLAFALAGAAFGGSIGGLADANRPVAALLMGLSSVEYASYLLSANQTFVRGDNTTSIPATTADSSFRTSPDTSASPGPVFITQPNLGFVVVLTANYLVEGAPVNGTNPGKVILASTAAQSSAGPGQANPVLTPADSASAGISDSFVGVPINLAAIVDASIASSGDGGAPTVLMGVDPGGRPSDLTSTATSTLAAIDNSNPARPLADTTAGSIAASAIDAIPEPSTATCFGFALAGLGWLARRQRPGGLNPRN